MRYVLAALAGFAVGVWTAYAVFSLSYGRALAVLPAVAVAVIAVIWMLGAITASLAALRARRAAAAWRAAYYEMRDQRRADASSSIALIPTGEGTEGSGVPLPEAPSSPPAGGS